MKDIKKKSVWVNWRKDPNRGKVPVNSTTGGNAMCDNPSTWTDYITACNNAGRYDGVGMCFCKGIGGIDIDQHTGANTLAGEVLSLFSGTYIEKSPSGTGYHIIFKVDTDRLPIVNGKMSPEYYVKNPHNELECYIGGLTNRFFTFTGNMVSACDTVKDCTDELIYFLNTYMKKDSVLSMSFIDKAKKSANGERFTALYEYGDTSAYNGDDSSADLALCSMLAFWLKGDEQKIDTAFRHSALYRDKWDRDDYRQATISKAVASCNFKPVGRPKKHEDNKDRFTIEALKAELEDRGISVEFNVISNSISIKGYSDTESAEHILSTMPTILYSELCGKYKGVTQQIISDYLLVLATRNRVNPVLNTLNSVKWDGRNHLEELYSALNISGEDWLSRTLILKWFWQGHALLRNNPECPYGADGVLTLAGPQGIGKTSFFRKISISPKFFREGQSIDYDKDSKRRALTTWICELGELDCTLKSDMGMLKAFITQAYDEYRLPYGRVDEKNARRTNLGATVNGTQFLIDPTGNRRFWTIPLTKIELDKLNTLDALQIWAQVWECYASKNIEGFRLTKDEQKALSERNSQCEKTIKGEIETCDILSSTDYRTLRTVTDFIAQHDSLKKYTAQQISAVLDKLGIVVEKTTLNGRRGKFRMLP